MEFAVTVEVELIPGTTTFLALVNAKELLVSYGWKTVTGDFGPAGKITVPEKRTITFVVGGKSGAGKEAARKDVLDALHNVGNFVRFIRHINETIKDIPAESGRALGEFTGSAVAGAGDATGLGSFGILGLGAVASALILAAVGAALVIAVKRG